MMVGVARADSVVEVEMLEHAVRDVLNRTALADLFGRVNQLSGALRQAGVVIDKPPEGAPASPGNAGLSGLSGLRK